MLLRSKKLLLICRLSHQELMICLIPALLWGLLQCYTQEYALYIAILIHRDSRSVIKVVRYGLNIACFPDEHAVELVERQIAKQQQRREEEE